MLQSLSTELEKKKMKSLTAGIRSHRLLLGFLQSSSRATYSTDKDGQKVNLESNPYHTKYAAKLKAAQETSPDEFKKKLDQLQKERDEDLRKAKEMAEEQLKEMSEQAEEQKKLDSILKLDLVKDKSAEEIQALWTEYHKDKDCVFATIPAPEYEEIYKRSKMFPTFLYPLPRGDGYEFMLQQFAGHSCNFTPLVQYQQHQDNAPICLSLIHYTELMEDKGIVLMKAKPNKEVLSVYESQLLALQVKLYYGLHAGIKFNFVRMFNNSPEAFKYKDLIREFEKLKQDYSQTFSS